MNRKPQTPLHEARRRAAKELGLPVSDPRVIRLATLQCAYDSAQAQLASGRTIDIDNLLKLDAALAEARASVPHQHAVNIQIVDGRRKCCPFCHTIFDPTDADPKPLPFEPEIDGPRLLAERRPSSTDADPSSPAMAFGNTKSGPSPAEHGYLDNTSR